MEKKNKKINGKAGGRSVLSVIFWLLLTAGLIAAGIYVVKIIGAWLIENFIEFASKTDAVVIVAILTGAISLVGVILSSIAAKTIEYRQSTKKYLHEKREKPYADFTEIIYRLGAANGCFDRFAREKADADIRKISRELTLWGSDEVLKKWLIFKRNFSSETESKYLSLLLEDVLFEIRKDMGQKRKNLRRGELAEFFEVKE